MITDLVHNSALLVALTIFYSFFSRTKSVSSFLHIIINGLLFGIIAILGMYVSVNFSSGISYDGRSIVMVLAGLFGGYMVAGIAAAMTVVYRIYLGGAGVWAGTFTIISAALIGLLFRRLYNNKPGSMRASELYGVGLLTHISMLLCQFLLPWPSGIQVIGHIWLPVMVVFPTATLLMGVLLRNQIRRVTADSELRMREELYSTTLRSIGDAVITTDSTGIITFMNQMSEQITGWAEKEAVGKPVNVVFNILKEDTGEKADCLVQKILDEGIVIGLANHTLLVTKHGLQIPIVDCGAPIMDEKGNITGVVLVFRDQIEERTMHRKLFASEKLFHTLIENLPVGIFRTDHTGLITYINPKLSQISGLTFQEAIGDGWVKVIHPDDRDELNIPNKQVKKDTYHQLSELRLLRPDGRQSWFIAENVPEKNSEGEIVGFIGTVTDVTEKKQYVADLQLAKEKAEESDRLKSAFLANMSHEIRTSLNVILGFINILCFDKEITESERSAYLSIIHKNSESLFHVNGNILDISRLETGQLCLFRENFNVQIVLEDLRILFAQKLDEMEKKNIKLRIRIPDSIIFLNADVIRFKQIFMNLLNNAIKFTAHGDIEFGIYEISKEEIKFFVADTGIGIKEEKQLMIFERFIQADNSLARKYGGTGLGLAIVKNLVLLMKGRISLESKEGKGTTIRFVLPV